MKKTILLLTVGILFSCPVKASYEFVVDSMEYSLTHPTAEGVYAMQYLGEYGDVIIPDSVTCDLNGRKYAVIWIYDMCFEDKEHITSIIIPNTVRKIGAVCFANCKSLTHIDLPNSITNLTTQEIGEPSTAAGAFAGCSNLVSVNLPNSIDGLPERFFKNCISLTSIVIPNSCRKLGCGCFSGCTSLRNITLPQGIILDPACFYNCSSLVSIENVGRITEYYTSSEFYNQGCFQNCTSLVSASIFCDYEGPWPSGLSFGGCINLRKLDLGYMSSIAAAVLYVGYQQLANLDTLIVKRENPAEWPLFLWDGDESVYQSLVIVVPCGRKSIYENTQPWWWFQNIVEDCSGSSEGIENDITSNTINVYSTEGRILLDGADGMEASVYSIDGRQILTIRDGQPSQTLPSGIYMVKVGCLPARKVVVIQ